MSILATVIVMVIAAATIAMFFGFNIRSIMKCIASAIIIGAILHLFWFIYANFDPIYTWLLILTVLLLIAIGGIFLACAMTLGLIQSKEKHD